MQIESSYFHVLLNLKILINLKAEDRSQPGQQTEPLYREQKKQMTIITHLQDYLCSNLYSLIWTAKIVLQVFFYKAVKYNAKIVI